MLEAVDAEEVAGSPPEIPATAPSAFLSYKCSWEMLEYMGHRGFTESGTHNAASMKLSSTTRGGALVMQLFGDPHTATPHLCSFK